MYIVDCREIQSFEDLIRAFNQGFVRQVGGNWNGNLDGLNDYLSWPEKVPYELVILGSARCSKILNFKASERHDKNLWPLIREILDSNQEWVHVEYR